MKKYVFIFLETIFFAVALMTCIPPVPSDSSTTYSYMRIAPLTAIAMIISRYCAIKNGSETVLGAILKTMIVLLAGCVVYLRIQIH